MSYSIHQSVAPTVEPVTLAQAKMQCRYTDTDEDEYITTILMPSARQAAETITNRQFNTATWELRTTEFPTTFHLPYPPLQSVTSIKYHDTAGVEQTLAASVYRYDIYPARGQIELAYGQTWPTVRAQSASITVTFKAGYGDTADDVPRELRQGILFLIAHWFANREPVAMGRSLSMVDIPLHVHSVFSHFVVPEFA